MVAGKYIGRGLDPTPGQRGPQLVESALQQDAARYGMPEGVYDWARRGPFRRQIERFPWVSRDEFSVFVRAFKDAFQPRCWSMNVTLAASASNSLGVQTGTDVWFIMDSVTGSQTGAYTLQLQETESGIQLFPTATSNGAAVGTAAQPFYLPIPWVVTGTLQWSMTDISVAANVIYLQLNGYMVYPGRLPGVGQDWR